MKSISFFLCFVFALNGYIGKTVTLWDVNRHNEARRITLFGDYHTAPGDVVATQYAAIMQNIKKRAEDPARKPLVVLLEQVPEIEALAFDELLLYKFSKLSVLNEQIAPGVSIENIEIRGEACVALSMLMAPDDLKNSLKGIEDIEFEDCDSVCRPLTLTFDDLFKGLKRRKNEISEKSKQLGLASLITPYFDSAEHAMNLLDGDLKKLNIDRSDTVIEVASRIVGKANNGSEYLQADILHAFAPLFDLHAVCKVREIDHNQDILMITGGNHMHLISYLLQQSGAWDISPSTYDSRTAAQRPDPLSYAPHPEPLSNEQLDILTCEPSYLKYMQIRLAQYAQLVLQSADT